MQDRNVETSGHLRARRAETLSGSEAAPLWAALHAEGRARDERTARLRVMRLACPDEGYGAREPDAPLTAHRA